MTTSPQGWFMGGEGPHVLRGGVPNVQDAGAPIEPRAWSNTLAVAGIGGEAVYTNVYVALAHANPAPWSFVVVPVVDRVEMEPIEVELAAVGAPTSQVIELSLMQPFVVNEVVRATYAPRGQWFQLLLYAEDAPDGLVSFDGFELEYEVEIEGKAAVNDG